jgi:hypothetical protein
VEMHSFPKGDSTPPKGLLENLKKMKDKNKEERIKPKKRAYTNLQEKPNSHHRINGLSEVRSMKYALLE